MAQIACERLRNNTQAWLYFLRAFDNDILIWLQAVIDDPHRIDAITDFYRTDLDFVVGVDDSNLVNPLQLTDGTLRYEQRLLTRTRHRAHATVLSGPQHVAGIWKNTCEPDRAGFLIDLSISEIETPFVWICASVRQNQLELELSDTPVMLRFDQTTFSEFQILLLAEREIDFDRIDG